MRDLGMEVGDHATDLLASLRRIDGVKGQTSPRDRAEVFLEICQRYEVSVVGSGLPARVGHRKQCDLIPAGPHQFHGFKEIDFSPAEPEVVFVAIQNSHDFLLGMTPCIPSLPRVSRKSVANVARFRPALKYSLMWFRAACRMGSNDEP